MSLATLTLEQLAVARHAIESGHEVLPTWRITTSEGVFLIVTQFDSDKPEQRERAMHLMARFMVWKMASSFVLVTEASLGASKTRVGDETLLAIGVSHHERLAALQRIRRGEALGFSTPLWLAPHHVDDEYVRLLPSGRNEVSAEEDAELRRTFGQKGELPARRLS